MRSLKDFSRILKKNAVLAEETYFRIGGPARYLLEPGGEGELAEVLSWLAESGTRWRMLGGGTNILVGDEGFDGAVVRLAGGFDGIVFEGTRVEVGAGARLGRLVGECAKRGLSGAECLAGIPGTVGGAIVANAGGKRGTIGDIVRSVGVMDGGKVVEVGREECGFAYRKSGLAGRVVVGVKLDLSQGEAEEVTARGQEILREKAQSQELSAASAGCIFRNSEAGESAGALIERAGCKGLKVGAARVSEVHANFVVNDGGATSGDVMEVIERVRGRVFEEFGVELELEIELW